MKDFIRNFHQQTIEAIQWNHKMSLECHTTTYAEAGVIIGSTLLACFGVCLFDGAYFAAAFFFALSIGYGFLARFVWQVINSTSK